MSEPSHLHSIVVEKFRKVFGEPHRQEGHDCHWGLRALAYIASINVLVNGGKEHPLVWVFNPHDPDDGVANHRITHESQIDGIVSKIQDAVQKAGRPR